MRSTRNYLMAALLALSALGAFWAVGAQEAPHWDPPAVPTVPTEERAPAKKAPILIGGKSFNEKPKTADPGLIIPAAAYEKPREVKGAEVVQTGGVGQLPLPAKDDVAPGLPALPGLIPEMPGSKPLALPELPAPLPTPAPTPMAEPTKVLIGDRPAKKELPALPPTMLLPQTGEKKEPLPTLEPKQAPVQPAPSMLEIKQPATLVAPNPATDDALKSFVRVRPGKGVAPPDPTPGPAPLPPPTPMPYPAPEPTATNLLTLQTPSLIVEKRGIGPAYQIVIRNVSNFVGRNIRVEDELPPGVKLASADPMPTMQGDKAVWVIAELASQGSIVLNLTLHTQGSLPQRHQTSVHVSVGAQTHTAAIPVRHEVRSPANPLSIKLLGPLHAAVGKPVLMNIQVSNQSNQAIPGIKLYGILPEGLDTPEGRKIEGPEDGMVFQAGETKTLKMPADAVKAGRYIMQVKVATPTGIEASDSGPIDIVADTLVVQQAAQTKLLPGREGDLRIEVQNNTGKVLRNVAVVNRLPDGLDFIGASEAGLYQANSRTVYWTIKELPEGKKQTLIVRVHGAKSGQLQNTVIARADGIAMQTSTGQVVLEGIADVTLRVNDRDGPAYVGREISYEVQVSNRGQGTDRNVRLQVQFPPGMTPKFAQGPMPHTMNQQTVVFEPIASIGPQGQAVFRVSALAQTPGDQRVRFAIVSEQVRNPLQREVSTMVYRD